MKANAKAKAVSPKVAATKEAAKPGPKKGAAKGAPTATPRLAGVDHEGSRSQYLVRVVGEKSCQFKYSTAAEQKTAHASAKKLCIRLCKEHGYDIPVSAA